MTESLLLRAAKHLTSWFLNIVFAPRESGFSSNFHSARCCRPDSFDIFKIVSLGIMVTCDFCYQFSLDDFSMFQEHKVCSCPAYIETMESPDDDATPTNFKRLDPSSQNAQSQISKNDDTSPFKPLTTGEVLQDLEKFPPLHTSNGTPKNLQRAKRIPRKLKVAKESKSSMSPVEDENRPGLIPDCSAFLSDVSTDSGTEDMVDDKISDDNLLLLPDALAMTRRSYEKCFNSCFKESASLTNSRRVFRMEELVTKEPSRSIWNFADGAQILIKGNC